MIIKKERTRLIITEFTDEEKLKLEDIVASMDNVFLYYDEDNKLIGLPTGMENTIRKLFNKSKFIDNSNTFWEFDRITPVEHNAQPRNQLQIDFIKFGIECINRKEKFAGILSPGTGKTFMACYLAIQSGLRTLIIAPTSGIKKQWADTLTGMFKVDPSKVKLVNNPRDFFKVKEDFVVVSQASLSVLNKTYDLEKIMKDNKFGFKVIDEVQMWFHNIIKVDACSNIANNLYLTGTFGRSGERENQIYQEMFGDLKIFLEKDKKPTLFDRKPGNIYGMKPYMNITMIWGHSGLSKEEIKSVTNSMRYSERENKWMRYGISVPAYTDLVIPSDGRITRYMELILSTVKEAMRKVNYGRTLVLGATISSAEIIKSNLEKIYPNKVIGTYHSRNDNSYNDKMKNSADILVSTISSAGTGFDMKDLSRLIVFAPYKSWILADQVSGRLRRRPDEKECFMWDIVDADIKQLRVWANSRASVFKRKSKKFIVEEK